MPGQTNPRKTSSLRELGPVDMAALRDAVLDIPEAEWARVDANKPNKFETLSVTNHIVLRFIDSLRDWRGFHDRPLWPIWRPLVEPVLAQATAPYGYVNGAFPRIMFARLPAGGVIETHVDGAISAGWPHKIHVPLTTNDAVKFQIGNDVFHLAPGFAYEVNNRGPHGVRNDGADHRIHLIFEFFDRDQPAPPPQG